MGYNTRQKILRKMDRAAGNCDNVNEHLEWVRQQFEDYEEYKKEKQYLVTLQTTVAVLKEKIETFRNNL